MSFVPMRGQKFAQDGTMLIGARVSRPHEGSGVVKTVIDQRVMRRIERVARPPGTTITILGKYNDTVL